MLRLSNLLPFNCRTWNDIMLPFAIIDKLNKNLEILNERMNPKVKKPWEKFGSTFCQRSTMVNGQWSTLVNSNRLGSTRFNSVSSLSFRRTNFWQWLQAHSNSDRADFCGITFLSSSASIWYVTVLCRAPITSFDTTLLENFENQTLNRHYFISATTLLTHNSYFSLSII